MTFEHKPQIIADIVLLQSARDLEDDLKNPKFSDDEKKRKVETTRNAEAQYLRFLRHKELPSNYSTVKIIGKGAFGEVKLVTRNRDGKIFALKSLVKTEMFKKEQLAHVRAERDILAESDSPWVVKLHTTFQDKTYLYMLMEFLPGGDLMTMLIRYEIFSLAVTRFYMAEIIMAIEEVHKHGYIHRYVFNAPPFAPSSSCVGAMDSISRHFSAFCFFSPGSFISIYLQHRNPQMPRGCCKQCFSFCFRGPAWLWMQFKLSVLGHIFVDFP